MIHALWFCFSRSLAFVGSCCPLWFLLYVRSSDFGVFTRPGALPRCLLRHSLGFLRQFTSFGHIFLLEAIRVCFIAAQEEYLVLPILLKLVDQVLDFEAHAGLDLSVRTLFKH